MSRTLTADSEAKHSAGAKPEKMAASLIVDHTNVVPCIEWKE
jgi:hypothetical protein